MKAFCEELHAKIDVVDEERYDIEAKVLHNNREVTHHQTRRNIYLKRFRN